MVTAQAALSDLTAGGKKIIGCFPLYPPLPLFHSMGLTPVVLWGLGESMEATPHADRHVQGYVCPVARRLSQFVLSEGAGMLDGVFFYNACDTLRNLPEVLQTGMEESGITPPPFFRMHVPMTPPSQTDAAEYLRNEAKNLIVNLEEAYGPKFSEEKFAESAALYGRIRALYLTLEEAVAEGLTSFAGFCETMARAGFLAPEDQERLLESAVSRLPAEPLRKTYAGRVFVSGILPPPPAVRRIMDEAGLLICGNDIASMRRCWATRQDGWTDAADYCVRYYLDHFPCSTLLNLSENRVEAVARAAIENGAEGFIFVGEKFCEYEYFDIPDIEKRLKEDGISVLQLEIAMDGGENVEASRTRIEAFAELLSQKAGPTASE